MILAGGGSHGIEFISGDGWSLIFGKINYPEIKLESTLKIPQGYDPVELTEEYKRRVVRILLEARLHNP